MQGKKLPRRMWPALVAVSVAALGWFATVRTAEGGDTLDDASPSGMVAFFTGAASADQLATHAAGRLAPYKCPRHFQPVARLPLTATGKINRRALREEWTAKT